MFDLGCNYGYFGCRLAFEYDCFSALVDTKPLASILKRNAPSKTIWLNKRLSGRDLQALSRSESFDVVLALNVVHHIPDWKNAVDALLNLGETVIFELPGEGDIGTVNYEICDQMREYVLSHPHEVLMEMESHVSGVMRPTVALKGKHMITEQAIDAKVRNCAPVSVEINSSPYNKAITIGHKRTKEIRDHIEGMNLWNWHLLNGAWPENIPNMVCAALEKLPRYHDDLRPWNFIIDGQECHAIDYQDKLWRTEPEKGGLEKCVKLLTMEPDYNNPEFVKLLRTI